MSHLRWFLVSALCIAQAACSSDGSDSSKSPEPASSKQWTTLIEGDWSLVPGEEKERVCYKKKMEEDVYISAIRPTNPLGTHHSILTMGDGDCTAAVASGLIYAAALGTQGLELPPGVAIKIPKGQTLNLGLHVYNVSGEPLSGTSGIEIVKADPEDVEFESETVLAGPLGLTLPPQQTTTVPYDCAVTTKSKVYAVFPHMHQLGRRLKTSFSRGGVTTYERDEPFTFDEQLQIPLDPMKDLEPGDIVHTECTFENDTNKVVTMGESSDTEMCFSVLFRYPAGGGSFCLPAAAP